MSRAGWALVLAAVLALLLAGAAFADDPTPTPTPTLTPTPSPTPPWELLVVLPVSGKAVLIERRWSYGEEAIFFAVMGLGVVVGLGWVYDVVRGEMVRPGERPDV